MQFIAWLFMFTCLQKLPVTSHVTKNGHLSIDIFNYQYPWYLVVLLVMAHGLPRFAFLELQLVRCAVSVPISCPMTLFYLLLPVVEGHFGSFRSDTFKRIIIGLDASLELIALSPGSHVPSLCHISWELRVCSLIPRQRHWGPRNAGLSMSIPLSRKYVLYIPFAWQNKEHTVNTLFINRYSTVVPYSIFQRSEK